jgi:hypothetical protein
MVGQHDTVGSVRPRRDNKAVQCAVLYLIYSVCLLGNAAYAHSLEVPQYIESFVGADCCIPQNLRIATPE